MSEFTYLNDGDVLLVPGNDYQIKVPELTPPQFTLINIKHPHDAVTVKEKEDHSYGVFYRSRGKSREIAADNDIKEAVRKGAAIQGIDVKVTTDDYTGNKDLQIAPGENGGLVIGQTADLPIHLIQENLNPFTPELQEFLLEGPTPAEPNNRPVHNPHYQVKKRPIGTISWNSVHTINSKKNPAEATLEFGNIAGIDIYTPKMDTPLPAFVKSVTASTHHTTTENHIKE